MRLKICPHYGLEIILPMAIHSAAVIAFLEKHRLWIEKNYKSVKPFIRDAQEPKCPETISLTALNQHWAIHYTTIETKRVLVYSINATHLIVQGNIRNKKMICATLHAWLKKQAEEYFIPWLQGLSKKTCLPFSKIKISNAQTQWGSCSYKKEITLSYRLLFLAPALVEYVMLHELCHTVHFNHSKQFWDLLKQLHPDCLALRKALRYANHSVPIWVLKY